MNYFKNKSQEVNKVYQTDDLSVFNQIKGNRPPNIKHIRRLSDSMKINGSLQNPIIVNENMTVIDGQHRLLAAIDSNSSIYYIIVVGYSLDQVHVLNLNQKNWVKKDFMEGYADMGIESYKKLSDFVKMNEVFNITDCISMCSNTSSASSSAISHKYRPNKNKPTNQKEVFEEGTWIGKDFKLAQENADKIKMIKQYYHGYNRSVFVASMLGLFKNENFIFAEFLKKLKINSNKLVDCTNVAQNRLLIEDIYNYKRREKVNLRY